jgi:hypothetical protein
MQLCIIMFEIRSPRVSTFERLCARFDVRRQSTGQQPTQYDLNFLDENGAERFRPKDKEEPQAFKSGATTEASQQGKKEL